MIFIYFKESEYDMARLFGIDILTGSRRLILTRCADMIGKGGAICTVNPEIMRDSVYNDALGRALSRSVNVPDGIGVAAALGQRGVYTDVFPGVELGEALLDVRPVRFGIIGGASGVAERAAIRLSSAHRSAMPVLAMDGYTVTERDATEVIKESGAELVFICMGSPKQELFIDRIRGRVDGVLFVALGGSADVYSGDKKRAPAAFRKMHFEWAYRMAREPRRILRAPKLFDFCFLSLIEPAVYRKIDKS